MHSPYFAGDVMKSRESNESPEALKSVCTVVKSEVLSDFKFESPVFFANDMASEADIDGHLESFLHNFDRMIVEHRSSV